MTKSLLILSSLLALTACNQNAAPAAAPENDTAPVAAATPDSVPTPPDFLEVGPVSGTWDMVGDDATSGARFTATGGTPVITIGCNSGSGEAFINWTLGEAATDGPITIATTGQTVEFSATASNDGGVHLLSADVAGTDPRVAILKSANSTLGFSGPAPLVILPPSAMVADVLNGCSG